MKYIGVMIALLLSVNSYGETPRLVESTSNGNKVVSQFVDNTKH